MKPSDPFYGAGMFLVSVIFVTLVAAPFFGANIILPEADWTCTLQREIVTNGPILGRAMEFKVKTVQVCDQWSRK